MADEDDDLEVETDEPEDLDEEVLEEDLEGEDELDEDFVAEEIDEALEVDDDLDTILKDRLVAVEDEEDEEEEEPADPEDKSDGGRVRPKAPGEFVCQSCFLVKHPSQLADDKRQLCTDCV